MQKQGKHSDEKRIIYEPYILSMLNMKIVLPIIEVGKNVKQNLERMIVSKTEGKCIVEGFIRPDSVRILTYSSGKVLAGLVEFQVTFECMVCHPVDGMLVEAICKTITKAGIHTEVIDKNNNVPVTVFIARDHHINNHKFEKVVENSKVMVSIIGVRFELNDSNICAIGKLVDVVEK
jgi:DNA-directed RNA polymerase subunit E'/Rpb7